MHRALRLPAHVNIQPSKAVSLQGIEEVRLASNVPVFLVTGGNEPVFKLELVFRAGKLFEEHRHAASASSSLMLDGTKGMTSQVLAEALEYYGATVRCYSTPDTLSLTVHAMTKFAAPVFDLVREVLLAPTFPEDELIQYRKKKIQRYKMGLTQNEYVANRLFSEQVFGEAHPYGYTSTPDDVQLLTPELLKAHHAILGTKCLDIFLAGDTRDGLLAKVEGLLLDLSVGEVRPLPSKGPEQTIGKLHRPGPQTHQVSVRIGKQIISRSHEDYPGLFLLNTILGGYHGSRLIRNLREDKGLTYNVQSNIESLLESTCFVVTTDANLEARESVVAEIYSEIDQLRTQLIGKEEIEMVKNYVCGNFLMQIDGPFNVVDTIKPLVLHNLQLTYFEEFIIQLREVTAKQMKALAEEYLSPASMLEVVVG